MMFAAVATEGVPLVESLVEKGWPGIIIILFMIVIRYQERQKADLAAALKVERDARLEDAKAYRDGVIAATSKVHESVDDLRQAIEFAERKAR